jgi:hypothetical protein
MNDSKELDIKVELSNGEKITHEEALSRVREGEELVMAVCPHCSGMIAIYIKLEL